MLRSIERRSGVNAVPRPHALLRHYSRLRFTFSDPGIEFTKPRNNPYAGQKTHKSSPRTTTHTPKSPFGGERNDG